MKKIQSLFVRNYEGDRLVRDEVVSGSEWVTKGEGRATIKLDGTCCLIRDGKLFKRYEVKKGGKPPASFEPACEVDQVTGKQQGWVPVGDGPEDQYHREGLLSLGPKVHDGTYELVGPKVQGGVEFFKRQQLIRHGSLIPDDEPPRTFNELKEWLKDKDIEGIVWHHDDGRMVKIKKKDFGLSRFPTLTNQ